MPGVRSPSTFLRSLENRPEKADHYRDLLSDFRRASRSKKRSIEDLMNRPISPWDVAPRHCHDCDERHGSRKTCDEHAQEVKQGLVDPDRPTGQQHARQIERTP